MIFEAVLYFSSSSGKSLKVAKSFNMLLLDVEKNPNIKKYKNIIIVCPTYGDEELPLAMEKYLLKLKLKNKNYAVCELGNFFGFEKEFGALRIIKYQLSLLGWNLIDEISIDSNPDIDWEVFENWKNKLLRK